jgi:hypothetical protein
VNDFAVYRDACIRGFSILGIVQPNDELDSESVIALRTFILSVLFGIILAQNHSFLSIKKAKNHAFKP